ncbi:hypothetical protein N7451_005464 [Penicillium sp. IBT 35674x]|nr:hypothetical protein N7451_005464 [Penicillium sp. IBT 35674x]
MSILFSNVAGFTKKSTASVMMFLGYCLGQFTGPQFFISTEAPQFQRAFRAFYSSVSVMIVPASELEPNACRMKDDHPAG